MRGIIITFAKIEDGKRIETILQRNGFSDMVVCMSGAQTLAECERFSGGLVISGYHLTDMYYVELKENLPETFSLLLIGSERIISHCEAGIMAVAMPLKVYELVNTVKLLTQQHQKQMRPKSKFRNEEEEKLVRKAKQLLMERNHISEQDAHYYLQKISMDTGRTIVESARMVLLLSEGE